MTLHDLFGSHAANFKTSHWENGRFVSECTICGRAMVKLPGLNWTLQKRAS